MDVHGIGKYDQALTPAYTPIHGVFLPSFCLVYFTALSSSDTLHVPRACVAPPLLGRQHIFLLRTFQHPKSISHWTVTCPSYPCTNLRLVDQHLSFLFLSISLSSLRRRTLITILYQAVIMLIALSYHLVSLSSSPSLMRFWYLAYPCTVRQYSRHRRPKT